MKSYLTGINWYFIFNKHSHFKFGSLYINKKQSLFSNNIRYLKTTFFRILIILNHVSLKSPPPQKKTCFKFNINKKIIVEIYNLWRLMFPVRYSSMEIDPLKWYYIISAQNVISNTIYLSSYHIQCKYIQVLFYFFVWYTMYIYGHDFCLQSKYKAY